MKKNKQIQKAGDNSQIVQANNINININPDKNEIKEISKQTATLVFKESTDQALELIKQRLDKLENIIIEKMPYNEDVISCFKDPSFQLLLKKAQLSASLTDKETDYQIITELLLYRTKNGPSGIVQSTLNRSLEVVSQIDEKALRLLTIVYCFEKFYPICCGCADGLRAQNNNYGKYIGEEDLFCSFDWIEHLDILDIVQGNKMSKFKKFDDYCSELYRGYSLAGIKINTLEYNKAREILSEAKINPNTLIPNVIMSDYVILPFSSINNMLEIEEKQKDGSIIVRKINDKELRAFKNVEELYSKDSNINKIARENFIKYWDSFPYLKKLHLLWDRIPYSFYITEVGKNIAYANAKILNLSLPNLSFKDR